MVAEARPGSLPFNEAIDFFRSKVDVPTERWTDVWKSQHDQAFMVAGAMKAELLADLRAAVDKAIAEGVTLDEFREDFDAAASRHGWVYRGGRAWRTETIYRTNLRTAHAAGRFEQMTHPDVLADRPFWAYRHGDSIHPRVQHEAWDGLVLRASDPWWITHFAPNGWGCNCGVDSLSQDDLDDLGKKGPDTAPPVKMKSWTDKVTGEVHRLPEGIDPGWDYTPGRAARAAQIFADKAATLPADLGAAMMAEGLDAALPGLSESFRTWAGTVMEADREAGARLAGALSPRVARITEAARAAVLVEGPELAAIAKAADGPIAAYVVRVPELLARPTAVLRERETGALLYVAEPVAGVPADRLMVVRVEIGDPAGTGPALLNRVRALELVRRAQLAAAEVIEGGLP